jgi:hypothetical protein
VRLLLRVLGKVVLAVAVLMFMAVAAMAAGSHP